MMKDNKTHNKTGTDENKQPTKNTQKQVKTKKTNTNQCRKITKAETEDTYEVFDVLC